jgi:hypothetical protein
MNEAFNFDHIFPPGEIGEIRELLARDPESFRKRYEVELTYHHEIAKQLRRLQRKLEGRSPFSAEGTSE